MMPTSPHGPHRRTPTTAAPRPAAPAAVRLLLALVLTIAALSGCGGTTTPATPPNHPYPPSAGSSRAEQFLRLQRGYQADYEPASSLAELARRSDIVATGRLESVREGRILGTSVDDPLRVEHVLYVFHITDVLKGSLPDTPVGVEVTKPGFAPAADLDRVTPKNAEAVLYARRLPSGTRHEPSLAPSHPLPAGVPLLQFTTPQGFLVEIGGHMVHPLERGAASQRLFQAGDGDPSNLQSWLPPTARRSE
jgi:hypothetical protein